MILEKRNGVIRGRSVVLILSLCLVFLLSGYWGVGVDEAYAMEYARPMPPEYLHEVEKVGTPQEQKTLWNYLSFFSWGKKEVETIKSPAFESTTLKGRVKELGRQLLANSREGIVEEYVVTVNSFVNLNNLYKTSSLGRYIGEELIGDLQMAGVEVIDVRKGAGIMIHEKAGEYGLSRDMKELSYIHNAQAMIVGTYTYADGQIFVNARVLRNIDGMVLSNASLAFDLDSMTSHMLADEAMPPRKAGVVRLQNFSAQVNRK